MIIKIKDIEIELTRKKIKNIILRVLPPDGKVYISAPLRSDTKQITEFVESKIDWIKKKQVEMTKKFYPYEGSLSSANFIVISGNKYPLEIIYTEGRNSVTLCDEKFILHLKNGTDKKQADILIIEWYRKYLNKIITYYMPIWEKKTGFYCSSWQIKKMKTRWGTCNIKTDKIWFSLWLATKPLPFVEYVILHELAHTKVGNHGKDFKAILDTYMPDWEKINKM